MPERPEMDDESMIPNDGAGTGEEAYIHSRRTRPRRKGCACCLGCGLRLLTAVCVLAIFGAIAIWVALFVFPPFGDARVAQVLLVGLDEQDPNHPEYPRRADTIILTAVKLNGSGVTMLSVPRDSRVGIPGVRGKRKINSAYAIGKYPLLKNTLAQPDVMDTAMPYYVIFSSTTLKKMVDAAGGVTVDVPFRMKYDDNYQNLHIDLQPGEQMLNGEQAVGFVRWRKNSGGEHRAGTDMDRAERQQLVVKALAKQLLTMNGLKRIPNIYQAFSVNAPTNMNLRQLIVLGLNFKHVNAQVVPGDMVNRRGVSYVESHWSVGRALWQKATQ